MALTATRRALLYRPRAAANLRALRFDGTGDYVNCGSGATLDDLHAGAFTVEMWYRHTTNRSDGIAGKGGSNVGWLIYLSNGTVAAYVNTDGTDASCTSTSSAIPTDNVWRHYAMTYDNGSDRKIYHWVNGSSNINVGSQVAATGTIVSDAATNLSLGAIYGGVTFPMIGDIAWVRISNVVRYTGTFTPAAITAPPDTDANTVLLLKMDEGSGNPQDSSGNGNHGALAGDTYWVAQ